MPAELHHPFRVAPFRWMVGVLCALIGALMLVEPHQFEAPVYHAINSQLQLLGAGFLVAGAALLCVAALLQRSVVSIGVHTAAGAMLLFLARGFSAAGAWGGVAVYGVLGLGTILAAVLPERQSGSSERPGELLAVVTGTSGLVIGLLMLLAPGQFGASTYDAIRPGLAVFGAAFVASSIGLIVVQIYPSAGQAVRRAIHLVAAGVFLVFMVKVALDTPTGIAFFGGFGLMIGLHPWLTKRLPAVDPTSLQTRSALVLVAAAALPLIGAVGIVADQAEQLARALALAQEQTLAVALASGADDYIRLHGAAASGLASTPGLLGLSPEAGHAQLRDFSAGYPEVVAFSLYDVDGAPLARSDDLALTSVVGRPVYEIGKGSNKPTLDILISPLLHRPIFAFGAPIRGAAGEFVGLVAEAVESTRMADRITQASGGKNMLAYLVDAQGRAIAHPDAELVGSFADLSATPPVAAFLLTGTPSGNLTTHSRLESDLWATHHSPISAGESSWSAERRSRWPA